MYRILPLLCDAGLGMLVYAAVSSAYGVENRWWMLCMLLIFLPDLDALPQLRRKGYAAASSDDPSDHRELLHKPLWWLLPSLGFSIMFGFPGTLLFFLFLAHFLHDSVLTGWGVQWLSPWSKVRVKFFVDENNHESLRLRDLLKIWGEEDLKKKISEHGNEHWIRDLYLRLTVVSAIEYTIFALGAAALCATLFTSV